MIGQCRKLIGNAIAPRREIHTGPSLRRRMAIELRNAVGQIGEKTEHPLAIHLPAVIHPEDVIVDGNAGARQPPSMGVDQRPEKYVVGEATADAGACGAPGRTKRLVRQPDRAQPEVTPDAEDELHHRRMQLHMVVGVHMIERQAGRAKTLELGANLGGELTPHLCKCEEAHAGKNQPGRKQSISADEIGNTLGRKDGTAADQNEMQPDPERRQTSRPLYRVLRRRRPDHQTRGIENALAVRPLDRFVDGNGSAEIIARNDQPLQVPVSRARRKCMNSTPSRSRRFVISQLCSISIVISAILRGRK